MNAKQRRVFDRAVARLVVSTDLRGVKPIHRHWLGVYGRGGRIPEIRERPVWHPYGTHRTDNGRYSRATEDRWERLNRAYNRSPKMVQHPHPQPHAGMPLGRVVPVPAHLPKQLRRTETAVNQRHARRVEEARSSQPRTTYYSPGPPEMLSVGLAHVFEWTAQQDADHVALQLRAQQPHEVLVSEVRVRGESQAAPTTLAAFSEGTLVLPYCQIHVGDPVRCVVQVLGENQVVAAALVLTTTVRSLGAPQYVMGVLYVPTPTPESRS